MDVGYIGLGKMGRPMARRLLRAGHAVQVFNRSPEPVQELVSAGARAARSAADVAMHSSVVLTALPTAESVEAVYTELAGAARPGQVFIDHSTVSPDLNRHCAEWLHSKDAAFLDAPVSGGPAGAESGTLTVMVGGDEAAYERVRPVLEAYGTNIRRCGPVGAGQTVKLVNQLLVAVHTAAAAEATVFGVKLGADPHVLLDMLGTSFGGSQMLVRNLPRFISGDFSPATPAGLILKDLGLVKREAAAAAVPLLLGSIVEQLFIEAGSRGMAAEDMSAVVRLAEEAASVAVVSR